MWKHTRRNMLSTRPRRGWNLKKLWVFPWKGIPSLVQVMRVCFYSQTPAPTPPLPMHELQNLEKHQSQWYKISKGTWVADSELLVRAYTKSTLGRLGHFYFWSAKLNENLGSVCSHWPASRIPRVLEIQKTGPFEGYFLGGRTYLISLSWRGSIRKMSLEFVVPHMKEA